MSTGGVDMRESIKSKSQQLNADDLIAGPITGKVLRVFSTGSPEQPVGIDLDCWPEPYKPCKGMRRIMVDCWGIYGDEYVGKSMTLFRNPDVKYGGIAIGGIEISHLSDIPKAKHYQVTVTKGKKKPHVVEPLRLAKTTQPKNEERLLVEFADLCERLHGAKTKGELDVCLAECTKLKPRLDAKSIGTLSDLVKTATGVIASQEATTTAE